MSYTRTTYVDDVTPLSANNMNKLDIGLYLTNNSFTTTGSANAYVLSISGITAQTDLLGIPLKVKTNFAITGACTLNVNSYGAYAIRKDVSSAMISGDILSGQIIIVVWDGTYYQFMGECAATTTASNTQTLTNKTLTTPTLTTPRMSSGTSINDTNGNELIKFPATVTSAVNEVTISNAATGSDPSISATGGDTNIDLNLVSKGTGKILANGAEVALKSDVTTHEGLSVFSTNVHGLRINSGKLEYYDSTAGLWVNLINKNPILFGDGSDGNFSSTGNTTFTVASDDAYYVSKQYKNFTLNAGHTMSVDKRNRGLIIRCTGDCVINGIIDQSNKAANINRNTSGTVWVDFARIDNIVYPSQPVIDTWIAPAGGAGGSGGQGGVGSFNGGTNGSNAAFGSSSGGGGGGGMNVLGMTGGAGGVGGGGNGGSSGAGGVGANNTPGSSGGTGGYGGGGGLVIIIAQGSITIGATGQILCNGGTGAAGQSMANGSSGGGGGGGAGGGVVWIGYGTTYTNSGTINVTAGGGGSGGVSTGYPSRNGSSGSSGSIGSITTKQVT